MTSAARSRVICLLAWFLLIAVPLAAVGSVAFYWTSKMQSLTDIIERREDQLSRYRRLIATLPEIRAEIERVRANDSFKAFYFNAPTAALAGAELQRTLQSIVTTANGRLLSAQILPSEPGETPQRVRVRMQIQGSTDTLLDVLYELEQARPFLFLEQVSVRSGARAASPQTDQRGRPLRRAPVDTSGELTIRLDVFGFSLGGEA